MQSLRISGISARGVIGAPARTVRSLAAEAETILRSRTFHGILIVRVGAAHSLDDVTSAFATLLEVARVSTPKVLVSGLWPR